MISIEIVFNDLLNESYENLNVIDKQIFNEGQIIEDKLIMLNKLKKRITYSNYTHKKIKELRNNESTIETDIIIKIADYHAIVCSKSIYSLLKKLLYCENMNQTTYRSFIGKLLLFEQHINKLNNLDYKLWDIFNPSDSGVLIELKRMAFKLETAITSECINDTNLNLTNLRNDDFKTMVIEIGSILITQLNMIRIATVNSIIKGSIFNSPESEFHVILREYIKWITNVSKKIKVTYE